jgi:hypothetical protein
MCCYRRFALIVCLSILLLPAGAAAQQPAPAGPAPWRVYFGGSALLSIQPAGSVDGQQGPQNLGGTGLGVSGLFGAGRRVSLEAEVSLGGSLESTWESQTTSGLTTYSLDYRDTVASAFVRWHAKPMGRGLIEPMGGITLAFGHGTRTDSFQPAPGSPISAYTGAEPFSKRSLGFGGGVDVLVPVSGHVSLAGSARLHRLVWNDRRHFFPPEPGIGDWIVQLGGGVQVTWMGQTTPDARPAGLANATAAAKEAPARRGYVGGSMMVSHQPDGYADGHYLSAPLGGTGIGFSGVIGAFIVPHLSVEAEVSVGPALTAEQWFIIFIRNSTRYRDTLFSGFLRWHAAEFQRFAIEPVVGVTVAAGHAARTAVNYSFDGTPNGPAYDASFTRITFGAGGGVDFVVPVSRPLAVTASFRLHVLDRDDERDGPPELGIGPWIYQFGGGLRWRF